MVIGMTLLPFNEKKKGGCEEIVPKKTRRHITESSDGYVPFVV